MFHDLTRVAAIQLGSDNQLQTKPVSETSGQFQHMSVTYFAVHVLKCTDTYVQAHITFFDIMVILWNGCIFLYIALIRLLVYLNWVNLLYRSVWPHCPYMVQCNTVYCNRITKQPSYLDKVYIGHICGRGMIHCRILWASKVGESIHSDNWTVTQKWIWRRTISKTTIDH